MMGSASDCSMCFASISWGNRYTVNQTLIQHNNLSGPSGFFEGI